MFDKILEISKVFMVPFLIVYLMIGFIGYDIGGITMLIKVSKFIGIIYIFVILMIYYIDEQDDIVLVVKK